MEKAKEVTRHGWHGIGPVCEECSRVALALDAECASVWEEAARVADEWNDQQGTGREIASVLRARAAELREEGNGE